MARQNGKTDVLIARMLGGACELGERVLYVTASNRAAVDMFARLVDTVDAVPALSSRCGRRLLSNGRERVEFDSGGLVEIATAGGTPPRGFDKVALLVFDEARELPDWKVYNALTPTQRALRSWQRWIVSNAGHDRSRVLNDTRDRGRAAAAEGKTAPVWLEWSAPDDVAVDDVAALAQANPALGHLLDVDDLLEEAHLSTDVAGFRNEQLCQWVSNIDTVVDISRWDALEDPGVPLPAAGGMTLGFEVSLDRSWSSIGAAYTAAHRNVVQCVENNPGVDWLVPQLVKLARTWRVPVIAHGAGGPAPDVADELRRALDGDHVTEVVGFAGRDYAAACVNMLTAITDRRFTHANSDAVRRSLAGAGTRAMGDTWVWAPRASTTSIAPLVAVTCALWAHQRAARSGAPVVRAVTSA